MCGHGRLVVLVDLDQPARVDRDADVSRPSAAVLPLRPDETRIDSASSTAPDFSRTSIALAARRPPRPSRRSGTGRRSPPSAPGAARRSRRRGSRAAGRAARRRVTATPRIANMQAYSQPITPPPTTSMRAGDLGERRGSRPSRRSAGPRTGRRAAGRAREPVAIRIDVAGEVRSLAVGRRDGDGVGVDEGARPWKKSTLCRRGSGHPDPLVGGDRRSRAMKSRTSVLASSRGRRPRGRGCGTRRGRAPSRGGSSRAGCRCWRRRRRGRPRSIRATLLPKYAACAAPFSPAGPEPITTRS